jgi:hypothetical protein
VQVEMPEIEPATLHRKLSEYLAGHHYDGLFIASLDHSPTEQLIGEKWHTSALILSAAVEHSALAHELGKIANPLTSSSPSGRGRTRITRNDFAPA